MTEKVTVKLDGSQLITVQKDQQTIFKGKVHSWNLDHGAFSLPELTLRLQYTDGSRDT